ncbi:MAG: hypothetical protein WA865_23590 [Spirulinaceae cyanobacterium]
MKEVLAFIDQKQQEFRQLPLMIYLQDKSISPQKRLAFAPCVAPFIMDFSDFNKYVLRQEANQNPIQQLINNHTYEDERHWHWFLEDLEKLGFNQKQDFNATLTFLWGEETKAARRVSHLLEQCIFKAEKLDINLKLAVSEAIEAAGVVMFSNTAAVAQELQEITQQEYRYFGRFHLSFETGHLTGVENIETVLETIQLSVQNTTKAFELVARVFAIFTELTQELLAFAKKSQVSSLPCLS